METPVTRRSLLLAAAGLRAETASVNVFETPYKYGKLILQASDDLSSFDSRSVDCPFVFHHGHSFYMTYAGFDGVGYQTGLAASEDLLTWRRLGCILRRDPSSPVIRYNVALNWILRENALHSPGRAVKVNGRFLGVFHAYPGSGYEQGPAVIGLCTSHDLLRWEIGDIVLRPEDGAAWERGGLYKPCLVSHRGTYYLFYNAKNAEKHWREQTGLATSTDLKHWKRYEGNPVIANGPPGSPDERFASDPCVLLYRDTWAAYYYGLDARGRARDLLALGKSPEHFEKVPAIMVDAGPPGSVDEDYAHKPGIVFHDGSLYHFYCAVSGRWPHEVRGISVARSRPWKPSRSADQTLGDLLVHQHFHKPA